MNKHEAETLAEAITSRDLSRRVKVIDVELGFGTDITYRVIVDDTYVFDYAWQWSTIYLERRIAEGLRRAMSMTRGFE